jgi:serine/threonine-protein kinase
MAPEQIRGEPADGRTDQFSWAVVAYELMCGKVPWRVNGTDYGAIAAIVSMDPAPLRTLAPDVPVVAAEVIARALQKDPARRFPTMEALVSALEPVVGASSARLLEARGVTDPMLPFLQTVDTVSKPSAFPEARRARRAKRLRRATSILLVVTAVGVGAVVAQRRVASPSRSLPAPASGALPASSAAAAAYAMGLEARRNGMMQIAATSFRRTLELDADFAPALLRLALLDSGTGESLKEARDLFQRASVLKGTLGEADRALLDAMAPCVSQDDISHDVCEEQLRAAVGRFPREMEIRAELAAQQTFADEVPAAIATCEAALAIDPGFLYFTGQLGQLQAYAGRIDEALATLGECTKTDPTVTVCIDYRAWIHTQRDECAAVENDAKNWIAAAPREGGHWGPHHYLANAQIALGRPIEAVKETLKQEWARTAEDERASVEALDRVALGVLEGDFESAEASIATLESLAAADSTEDAHATPAALRVELYDEEGRTAEMGDAADAFLRRRDGWTTDSRIDDWEMAKDVTMRMNDALLRAGKITRVEYVARRAAWAGKWGKTRIARYDWFQAYAYWPRTKGEAIEALGAMPSEGLPPFHPFIYPEGAMGRIHLLTDDLAGALPLLHHAADGCFALEDPFTTVRSRFWLGLALEKTGDTKGACDAYAFVIERWGGRTPRSVTGEEAKKHRLALKCSK